MKNLSIVLILILVRWFSTDVYAQTKVEKWGYFEVELRAAVTGNPFTDVRLEAIFYNDTDTFQINGFYDGEDSYKIRFMPQQKGRWDYVTRSNNAALDSKKGSFLCVSPKAGNRGSIVVKDTFYFSYKDSTPFYPLGTTAYGWVQQDESTRANSLKSLKNSPFNKVRFMILPHAPSGKELTQYPYEGSGKEWNFTRFNPEYFRKYEQYILELQSMGIQADIVLFHPYDKGIWGFDKMDKEEQYLYLNYVNARFGAFRNVWWSMANEFDLMTQRTMDDWDGYFRFFAEYDPYQHLRSNHNAGVWYDHTKPWVTHASIQSESWWRAPSLREEYQKPIIFDEFCYEGNGDARIVALNGDVIRHRFWLMTVLGAYGTHGEAYFQPNTNYQFFRQGGTFVGESVHQLKILDKVLDRIPGQLTPMGNGWRLNWILAGVPNEYYLYYLGEYQNSSWVLSELPQNQKFTVDLVNTISGDITRLDGQYAKGDEVSLPGEPYFAMILRRAEQ